MFTSVSIEVFRIGALSIYFFIPLTNSMSTLVIHIQQKTLTHSSFGRFNFSVILYVLGIIVLSKVWRIDTDRLYNKNELYRAVAAREELGKGNNRNGLESPEVKVFAK